MADRENPFAEQTAASDVVGRRTTIRLSPDELRILLGLAAGRTYRTIATEIGLAPATIAYHANRLQQRLHVNNNVSLIAFALVAGVLTPSAWPPELSGITEIDLPPG